jgi:SAM-dependent methyltransferase
MYGLEPSEPGRKAAELFTSEGITKVLELGGGQGRDTLFFARSGLRVDVLEYTEIGVEAIRRKAQALDLAGHIVARRHDVRNPLPFEDGSFDACYSHMLFCMALTTSELERLFSEVWRVLRPGGLSIYTVRNIHDPHYGSGIHRGEDMHEVGGFIVHFFSKEKVEALAKGFHLAGIEEFEEGELPRRLFRVVLRKEE